MPRKAPGLHAVRFRHFFEQLVKERGGNASAAAAAIGMKQSFSSMILNGSRNASWDTIRVARQHIPLSHRFFDDPSLGDAPDYHAHVEGGRAPAPAVALVRDQVEPVEDEAGEPSAYVQSISTSTDEAIGDRVTLDLVESGEAGERLTRSEVVELRQQARVMGVKANTGTLSLMLDGIRARAIPATTKRPSTVPPARRGGPKSARRRRR
jgi:hypothetical protein